MGIPASLAETAAAERVEDEMLILPWDAVKSKVTKEDYYRDSRWFLEFAGFVDPKVLHHKRGPNFAHELERAAIDKAMVAFIGASSKNPLEAKLSIIRFIRALNGRVAKGEIGATEVRRRLTPIKLALEVNEIALPWKRLMRLLPAERRSKDREYKVEEIRKILSIASIHLQVAILLMASSGMRIGAFQYLNVGHVKPVESEGNARKLLCGKVLVYAGEGDDEYETLISKEAYLNYVGLKRLCEFSI